MPCIFHVRIEREEALAEARPHSRKCETDPYKTLHAHLQSETQGAALTVVIGYAFHDRLVNEALAAAVNANRQARVLVVDPGITRTVRRTGATHRDPPFEHLKLGLLECRWSGFTWLAGKFGDKRVAAALVREIEAALQS